MISGYPFVSDAEALRELLQARGLTHAALAEDRRLFERE